MKRWSSFSSCCPYCPSSSVICISPPKLQSSVLGEIAVMKEWRGSTTFNRLPQPVSSDIFWNLIHEKLLAVGFAFGIYHQSLPTEAANIETNLQNWLFFWKWGYRISIYSHFPFGSRIVAWTLHVPVPIQLEMYCISYLFILPCYACSGALEKFAAVLKKARDNLLYL